MNSENLVQKIWNLCNILRGDGISYHEYISELTYLLFLKIAQENKTEDLLPVDYRWSRLADYDGADLLTEYRDMLTYLGGHATSETVRKIYTFPTTVFSHSENLKAVIDGISKLDWAAISADGMGDIYEGLLAKNSQDARSGAGQYFTPRALVDCMVRVMKPSLGELIQDPATGTGGFLISANQFVRGHTTSTDYENNPPHYEGVEIEKGTYRICLMNAFLHRLDANIILGDALTVDAEALRPANLILANPPFGAKAGSARKNREDILAANKQLAFLQHIYSGLEVGGRAAVVLPDNVLFEEGVGKRVRTELMEKCNLHTILRLPSGIFYSQGVKTNVLFFTRVGEGSGNTENIWIYDLRAGSAKYGKKRPLSESDFKDFEQLFGDDPTGVSPRTCQQDGNNRWRVFSRREIADRNDNLDISWLSNSDFEDEDIPMEPEEIAAAIFVRLQEAINGIKELTLELDSETQE